MLTIAFQPIGLVFLPLLSRLCREDFQAARRSVATLATCALHLAVFTTPQLLLFADVAVRAWLGHRFDAAAPVIRLTVLPTAAYLFYLILRSTLDAAAVKGYNSRNNVIALASAAIAVTAFLGIGVGKPVESIAGAFAFGIAVLGTLTLATVHSVYRLERRSYALAASLALGLVTAGIDRSLCDAHIAAQRPDVVGALPPMGRAIGANGDGQRRVADWNIDVAADDCRGKCEHNRRA